MNQIDMFSSWSDAYDNSEDVTLDIPKEEVAKVAISKDLLLDAAAALHTTSDLVSILGFSIELKRIANEIEALCEV